MFIFKKFEIFFGQPFWCHCRFISRKLLINSRNQNIFQKFKLNWNLPLKRCIICLCCVIGSQMNERVGRGRPEPPSSLILLLLFYSIILLL